MSEWNYGLFIDTLAAAYAENGDFSNAIKWQQKAIEMTDNDNDQLPKMKERLALYESGKPYREEPKK